MLGRNPAADPLQLARVGFVAQDTPDLCPSDLGPTPPHGGVAESHLGRRRGRGTHGATRPRPGSAGGSLSGGQRAQLALTLAIAKRPDLLLLDEPVASLDPLARREFLQVLMEVVAEHGVTVVLSSHLVADLERVCDHLVILVASQVQLAGDVAELLAQHRRISGPRRPGGPPANQEVIEESGTERQSTMLVRTCRPTLDPEWTSVPVTLEDVVLAYMGRARGGGRHQVLPSRTGLDVVR